MFLLLDQPTSDPMIILILENAMVPFLIRKAYDNDILEVWGDGSPIRDFIHCRDVAMGMMHLVKNKVTEPVNLGAVLEYQLNKLLRSFQKNLIKILSGYQINLWGIKGEFLILARAQQYGFKTKIC